MPYLISEKDYIAHHGIKGQKWGVRRFRNEDGTLTEAGKRRLTKKLDKNLHKERSDLLKGRALNNSNRKRVRDQMHQEWAETDAYKRHQKAQDDYNKSIGTKKEREKENAFYNVHFDTFKVGGPWSKHAESYVGRFAEATLQDLNLPVNQSTIDVGSAWVRQHGFYI